jgi:F0F1-type ATP synthase gamma subunit
LALNAYVHYCELAIVSPPEFPSQALDADLIKRLEAFVKAKEKLSKLIGLLKLMRLRHAVSAVEQYYEVIREVTQNLNFHDLSPRRRESAMNLFAKLKSEQEHVEVSLSTEYDKI